VQRPGVSQRARCHVVEQALCIEQVGVREGLVVVDQLEDGECSVGVGDRLRHLSGGGVEARERVIRSSAAAQVDLLDPVAEGIGEHVARAALVARVRVRLAQQERVAHQLGQVAAGLVAQPLDAVVHERDARAVSPFAM